MTFPAFTQEQKAVTLKQVIDQVGDPPWRWRILVFEATSSVHSGLDVIDLERRVERAENGVEISSRSLRELANQVDQIIDIHLIAHAVSGMPVFRGGGPGQY